MRAASLNVTHRCDICNEILYVWNWTQALEFHRHEIHSDRIHEETIVYGRSHIGASIIVDETGATKDTQFEPQYDMVNNRGEKPSRLNLMCLPCRNHTVATKDTGCDLGLPCNKCKTAKDTCSYPEHIPVKKTVTAVPLQIGTWESLDHWSEIHGDAVSIGEQMTYEDQVEPEPNGPHYEVVASG